MAGKQKGYTYIGFHIKNENLEGIRDIAEKLRDSKKDILNDAIEEYLINRKKVDET